MAWAPDKFVALSGVFDIAPHFAHERSRLVHWISPMWLAMIGRELSDAHGGKSDAADADAADAACTLLADFKVGNAGIGMKHDVNYKLIKINLLDRHV